MNKKWMAVPAAALVLAASATSAAAVTNWSQGFEVDTAGWFGSIERVSSGTKGIASATGASHAEVGKGAFSRFAGYEYVWDGPWMAEAKVYLDSATMNAGSGYDYTVAASGTDSSTPDSAHLRDFIFHVTKDTSTGQLIVAASNNTNNVPREDLETLANHYVVTEAGWFTMQHSFYEKDGVLAVDMNLLDANGEVVFTETRTNAADMIPTEVGGNRYAWFPALAGSPISIDDHRIYQTPTKPVSPTSKTDCMDDGWQAYGFKNQGQCIASLQANLNADK